MDAVRAPAGEYAGLWEDKLLPEGVGGFVDVPGMFKNYSEGVSDSPCLKLAFFFRLPARLLLVFRGEGLLKLLLAPPNESEVVVISCER